MDNISNFTVDEDDPDELDQQIRLITYCLKEEYFLTSGLLILRPLPDLLSGLVTTQLIFRFFFNRKSKDLTAKSGVPMNIMLLLIIKDDL